MQRRSSRRIWSQWRLLFTLLALSSAVVAQQLRPNRETAGQFGCDCMEYWNCVTSGGSPYSYCGSMESSVCCFIPQNAKPVGILPVPSKSKCGRKGSDSGRDGFADLGEWPWHAAILEKPQDLYVCGATLVDESWVITAAHCVDDYSALSGTSNITDVLKVRLGEYDVSTTSEPLRHEEFDVSHIVVNPSFNNLTLANDIALVRLAKQARRRPNIDVACIPARGEIEEREGTKCYITGWGRKTEDSPHSVILKEVPVPLWDNAKCQATLRTQFGPSFLLPETSICAGAEGRDSCDGDGGGPLVCEKDSQWYQVGVVSFGIGCGRNGLPGVYTRLVMFDRWVRETIKSFRKTPKS